MAVRRMDDLAFAVTVALKQNRNFPVFLLNTQQFVGDDGGNFVPRGVAELALAAVLRIALSVGVPIDADQRIFDAVGG